MKRACMANIWSARSLWPRFKEQPRDKDVELHLDHHFASKVYTTGSLVSGELVINPKKDMPFEAVRVCLTGDAMVRYQEVQATSLVSHNFLRLDMPISPSTYPATGIFQAGKAYRIPFNFVVPEHLPLPGCSHSTESASVASHHLRLPPTVGKWEKDDLAPEMTRVDYQIRASIVRRARSKHLSPRTRHITKRILIAPASPEDPPLSIGENDKWYTLTKAKTITNGRLSKASGTITAVASQPAAVYLSADGRVASSSTVPVSLTYSPEDGKDLPPQITNISASIRAQTWWSGKPAKDFPDLGRANYPYSVTLASEATGNGGEPWTQSDKASFPEDEGDQAPSKLFYVTTLEAPVVIPTSSKKIVPTFHSCLISRTYSVQVNIKIGREHIELTAPIQVIVEPTNEKVDAGMTLPSFEEAMEF